MAFEIISQGECYEISSTDDWGPAIPYGPIDHQDGHVNHGFLDVLGHSDAVAEIPEAKGRPGLILLLTKINAPNSHLMSLGCENGIFPVDPEQVREDGPRCYAGSYIDITFREPSSASRENVSALAHSIIDLRKPSQREWSRFEIAIQRMRHFFGVDGCYNLMLKIAAYGRDEPDAWMVFDAQCREMSKVFDRLAAQTTS